MEDIRAAADGVEADTGAAVLVTGRTALNIDISEAMSDALLPYLTVVIGLAVLLLLVVFRSVLVPVTAALGFLLSVGAAFGVLVAVFQWGWGADLIGIEQTGPVMSLMPILVIGIVFGLAMDYQVFLFTRVRESYAHGASAHDALVAGFRHSGRVVAAAAVIMVSVFAGFIGIHSPTIQTMGVGLASAVAFDAFVVRMAIIPAVLALLGDRAWWIPRILDRVLPNVDVEGDALSRPGTSPATEPVGAGGGRSGGGAVTPAMTSPAGSLLPPHVSRWREGSGRGDGVRALPARRHAAPRRHPRPTTDRRVRRGRGVVGPAPAAPPGAGGRRGGHDRLRHARGAARAPAEPARPDPGRPQRLLPRGARRAAGGGRGAAAGVGAAGRRRPVLRVVVLGRGREPRGDRGGGAARRRGARARDPEPARLPGGRRGAGPARRADPRERSAAPGGRGAGAHRP
ncbi:MMPL family transporter [Nocardioides sp. TF02-7]|uniref:MMPL family transporter n=1 Tax=Nocardioides sp. TF02-7 TaxID=2917724 RepID=UPI001F064338|nr:MMPL family transporter [Nocardioides sp. TF02-7]UMG91604.1 MMPL family transporter [Nocardioides sp. TF02-7]